MEELIKLSTKRAAGLQMTTKRYLYERIDWTQRLILILGHRGAGKTTLVLQRLKEVQSMGIYISLDNFYFEGMRLVEVFEMLYGQGYRHFYLDEVHRYAHWSNDLKHLYDHYEDVHLVVTGSSVLQLNDGQGDLSRRAAVYHLAGLSLREYIALEHGIQFGSVGIDQLVSSHQELALTIDDQIDILKVFKAYLQSGYYPFYREGKHLYKSRLLETTQLAMELDIAPFQELEYRTVRHMKKMLYIISQSVPLMPNISELASRLEVSRNLLLKMLDLLGKAKILILLNTDSSVHSYLQKPEKIYLQNTNLAYAFATGEPNLGNIRETFFANQVQVTELVTLPRHGDFMVNEKYVFEVGGPSKTAKQVKGVANAHIAADGITSGHDKKIPLWLFGFLY